MTSAKSETEPVVGGLACLDHCTRATAVGRAELVPGCYLAVGPSTDERFIPLTRAVTHLGRGLGATIRLDHGTVSCRHALIVKRGGSRWWLLDDRSSHGTFLNGRRVAEAELQDRDVLRLGSVVLSYRALQRDRATTFRRRDDSA